MSIKEEDIFFSRSAFYEFMLESEEFREALSRTDKIRIVRQGCKNNRQRTLEKTDAKAPGLEIETELEV